MYNMCLTVLRLRQRRLFVHVMCAAKIFGELCFVRARWMPGQVEHRSLNQVDRTKNAEHLKIEMFGTTKVKLLQVGKEKLQKSPVVEIGIFLLSRTPS